MTQIIELPDENIKNYYNYIPCVPESAIKVEHVKQKCRRYKKFKSKFQRSKLQCQKKIVEWD